MKRILLLILSITLFLTIAIVPVSNAENSSPELERVIPFSGDYVELSSPVVSATNGDYVCMIHTVGESFPYNYVLMSYKNGKKISEFSVGTNAPTDFAIYKNYAFIFVKSEHSLSVYNVNTSDVVILNDLPSAPDNFHVEGDLLYVQDNNNLHVYDITNIANEEIIEKTTTPFNPTSFSPSSFTVSNGVVYYDATLPDTTQVIYSFDTTSANPVSNEVLSGLEDTFIKMDATEEYLYALIKSTSSNAVKVFNMKGTENPYVLTMKTRAPTFISAYRDKLYTTHYASNTIDVYEQKDVLTYEKSICSNSIAEGRFHYPTSVYASSDAILVTDTPPTARVQLFDPISYAHKSTIIGLRSPDEVVGNNKTGYILDKKKSKIYYYYGTNSEECIFAGGELTTPHSLVMDKNETVYAINGEGANATVIKKSKMETEFTTTTIVAPIAISVSHNGSVIYALYSDKIIAYDDNYNPIFTTLLEDLLPLSFSEDNIKDVDTDAKGNMYILCNNDLIILTRKLNGFEFKLQKTLKIEGKIAGCKSISINSNGEVYLTGGVEHCLYKLNNSGAAVYNPNDYSVPDVTQKENITEASKYAKIKIGGGFVYDYINNYESTRVVAENTTLLLLDNESTNGMYFVYYNGKEGYLPASYATVHQATIYKDVGIALYDSTIYKYPVAEEKFALTKVAKDIRFDIMSDAFGYEYNDGTSRSYWYQILYNGKIFYIERNNVGEAEIEAAKDFGTAKLLASVINAKVKLYSFEDINSTPIGEFNDGQEVKLLEELNSEKEFTKVSIDGVDGYVLTSELTTGQMTTAEIILLVIIILGGAASVTILIISRKMYRKR